MQSVLIKVSKIMSQCKKLTLVAYLVVLLLGIIHLYRLQLKTSTTSLYVFVQSDEYKEENSLVVSKSPSNVATVDSLSDGTTSDETFPASSYGVTPTSTGSNLVVFYNR